jgi:hypothetical protein
MDRQHVRNGLALQDLAEHHKRAVMDVELARSIALFHIYIEKCIQSMEYLSCLRVLETAAANSYYWLKYTKVLSDSRRAQPLFVSCNYSNTVN